MHTQRLSSSLLLDSIFILLILLIFFLIPACYCEEADRFNECRQHSYSCGENIRDIGYPFWGDDRPDFCGHPKFELKCKKEDGYAVMEIEDRRFRVNEIDNHTRVMSIAWLDLLQAEYCPQTGDFIFDSRLFDKAIGMESLTLFSNCTSIDPILYPHNFTCNVYGTEGKTRAFYANDSYFTFHPPDVTKTSCSENIKVPINRAILIELSSGSLDLREALEQEFEVEYHPEGDCSKCMGSGGVCGSNETNAFVCICKDNSEDPELCRHHDKSKWRIKLIIGISASVGTLGVVGVAFLIHRSRKQRKPATSWVSGNTSSYTSSMTDLEKTSTCYGVHVFSYDELEVATNNFDSKQELGDGGFGTVYKGKLRDGRAVAVKRLYGHNYRRLEQFMNEVDLLAHLRHPNLVTLYGCTSRHCRDLLLVYEYIPNGTVADNLHGERSKPGSLSWATRMSIAIETASALTYLHASDVIHRDVKTNNILLEDNFRVKVADFGLSRLFPTDVTHVSTAPQGTPGYVDPEYHECYQLTAKSDVYSFGVVLIELISSKPAVDITRHRHEINLSNMAINMIQNRKLHELVDPGLGFKTNFRVREMITAVAELAFRCLQNGRDMRPSMKEVLLELKEIRSGGDDDVVKAEEVIVPADDVVLLQSDQLIHSPVSVMENWNSKETTPNASS